MMKATQEHATCENILNRSFKTGIPYSVLLNDITYFFIKIIKNIIYLP